MITIDTIINTTLEQIKSANRLLEYYKQKNEYPLLIEAGKKIKIVRYDLKLIKGYVLDDNHKKISKLLDIKYQDLIDKYFDNIK